MTKRIVSLMGVAAVATMVILAGCSSGPGAAPAEEDHTAALAGTWTVETMATVPNPAADAADDSCASSGLSNNRRRPGREHRQLRAYGNYSIATGTTGAAGGNDGKRDAHG